MQASSAASAAASPAMAAIYNRDYVLIIDKSGSMNDPEKKGNTTGKTRWQSCAESTYAIAQQLLDIVNQRPDSTGVELYLFSNTFVRADIKDAAVVNDAFTRNQPGGGTDLAAVLRDALKKYLYDKKHGRYKVKDRTAADTLRSGKTIVVITDGIPDNKDEVKKRIIKTTKKLDNGEELAISFLQVGDDGGAKAFLDELDEELTPPENATKSQKKHAAKFDIVDTVTMDEVEEIGVKEALRRAIFD